MFALILYRKCAGRRSWSEGENSFLHHFVPFRCSPVSFLPLLGDSKGSGNDPGNHIDFAKDPPPLQHIGVEKGQKCRYRVKEISRDIACFLIYIFNLMSKFIIFALNFTIK